MFYEPYDWEVEDECYSCEATGLSPSEPGMATICLDCEGAGSVPAGSQPSNGKPFNGRVARTDVRFVHRVTEKTEGQTISKLVTYDQFKKGFLPKD